MNIDRTYDKLNFLLFSWDIQLQTVPELYRNPLKTFMPETT